MLCVSFLNGVVSWLIYLHFLHLSINSSCSSIIVAYIDFFFRLPYSSGMAGNVSCIGPEYSIWWIALKISTHIHGPKRKEATHFGDSPHLSSSITMTLTFWTVIWCIAIQTFTSFPGWTLLVTLQVTFSSCHHHNCWFFQYVNLWLETCKGNEIPIRLRCILSGVN